MTPAATLACSSRTKAWHCDDVDDVGGGLYELCLDHDPPAVPPVAKITEKLRKFIEKLLRRGPIIANRGAPVPKSSPRGPGTTPKPVRKAFFHGTGVQRCEQGQRIQKTTMIQRA